MVFALLRGTLAETKIASSKRTPFRPAEPGESTEVAMDTLR
jgi:hypothetical protein